MKADILKKSILQWAIEGKLVPQLESEPTVEQIGETPEDVPFTIPEKWKWVNLSEVVISRDGERRPVKKSDRDNKEKIYDYYGATGIIDKIDSYLFDETLLLVGEDGANLLSRARDNAFIASGKYWVNNHAHVLEPRKTLVAIEYLQLYLSFISLAKYVTGSAQPKLTQKNMMRIPVPLPSVSEQQRIVAKLNEILPLVETYGKEKEALDKTEKEFPDKLRASLLQEAIQGKLVPQLESEPAVEQIGKAPEDVPFSIPEKWKWVAIGSVCAYIQRGKSPKYSEIQQIPVVAQKCNQWDGFHIEKAKFIAPETADSYKTDRWLQDKDVLWNSTGLGTLGRVALYKKQLNPYGCAVADSHVTVMRCSSSLLPEYLYYYICSPSVQSVVEEISDGSTKQKELATKTIREFQFPLPPIDEQRRIIAKLTELLNIARQLENSASIP